MLVSALQIVAKIKELPPDFAEHVHITGIPTREAGGIAEVNSFSDPTQEIPWVVKIKRAEVESNLNVTCTCPSVKLCMHVVAFYAVQKGIGPPDSALPLAPDKTEGPYEGALGDGKEVASELTESHIITGRGIVYQEIAAAFEKLAKMEEK